MCVCVSVLSCFTVWVVLVQNSVHVHTWDKIFVRFFIWISPSQTYVANQYSPSLILISLEERKFSRKIGVNRIYQTLPKIDSHTVLSMESICKKIENSTQIILFQILFPWILNTGNYFVIFTFKKINRIIFSLCQSGIRHTRQNLCL